ncbi:MAG TPA: sigma-70 family RNA polymerase sigma factor [Thermoanaerobaculia bacterium]|jgi:RNA polymerase sigma-70 factor (ECF subfamily)|nr:sigma-70 family RNA polymerase sigma factor [Thermoanaerobaculia bacterium]
MADASEPVQEIIERLQSGPAREEDFRRLFDLYYSRLVHFFSRRGFSPQDCLDLTQETFLGIYKGIATFRRDARFETWLFKIATNAYRKRLRWGAAEKRDALEVPLEAGEETQRGPRSDPPASGASAGEGMLLEERSRLLRQAVERLPEQMRKCLLLRVYREMKYREIASLLRLSPETVKVHLFQARRRLREELGPYFDDAIPEEPTEGVA